MLDRFTLGCTKKSKTKDVLESYEERHRGGESTPTTRNGDWLSFPDNVSGPVLVRTMYT